MWTHLTARASAVRALAAGKEARWLWHALRRNWPEAYAACLMPDHLHLLIAARDARAEHQSLAHLLGAFSRAITPASWHVAAPEPVRTAEHARRTVRYILLNPCRARLADDPLAWPWSTHRGVAGAELDPWVSAERLARALGRSPAGFARQLHAFVSGDPSVSPNGSPFPVPAPGRASPEVPLPTLVAAAAAATPWAARLADFHRVAVLLARHQGWDDASAVARAMGTSARTVRRLAGKPDPAALAAAALCLGDERLRRGAVSAAEQPLAA